MAGTEYGCTLSLDTRKLMQRLGIEERGRVQRVVSEEILRLCGNYVPLSKGYLKDTGHVENNAEIVWNGPYAHYMYEGIVYEDPELHCAGFKTENGWRSRKSSEKRKVPQKVPTERKLKYNEGSRRGAHWVDRMLQNGGRKKVEDAARRAVEP